jgi:hypothetical protein
MVLITDSQLQDVTKKTNLVANLQENNYTYTSPTWLPSHGIVLTTAGTVDGWGKARLHSSTTVLHLLQNAASASFEGGWVRPKRRCLTLC